MQDSKADSFAEYTVLYVKNQSKCNTFTIYVSLAEMIANGIKTSLVCSIDARCFLIQIDFSVAIGASCLSSNIS